MFFIRAPYPALQVTVALPSPHWSDSVALASTLQVLRAMNGAQSTYVRGRGGRKKFQWDFTLARNKALELRAFLKVYYRFQVQIVDHNEETWVGNLTNNPFESAGSGRAVDFPGGETMDITLEFEERE